MPNYNVKQFFTFKRITPRTLQQDNLVQFSYHSPENEIHDPNPLVYVVEKRQDRFWGFNLHYDSEQLVQLIDNANAKVDYTLQKEWLKKDPKNRQKLNEAGGEFNRGFIEKKDFNTIIRRVPNRDLEQFLIENLNIDTLRQYMYKRMNAVSKLVYKINQ